MSRSRLHPIVAVAALLAVGAPANAATIRLGDGGTTATRLVADMEQLALADAGHTVTRVGFSDSAAAAAALADGAIDAYVGQTDQIVEEVYRAGKRRRDANMRSLIGARTAAAGLRALGYSAADDAPSVACRRAVARSYRIGDVRRLPRVAPALRYGATPEHLLRGDGYWALRSTFRWVSIRGGATRFGLIKRKRLDCVQSTFAEPWAARIHLRTLGDSRRRLAGTPRRTVTVITESALDTVPQLPSIADGIARKLNRSQLVRLRGHVELARRSTPAVARSFLVAIGVLPPS